MTGQAIFTAVLIGGVVALFIYMNFIFPKKNKGDNDENNK